MFYANDLCGPILSHQSRIGSISVIFHGIMISGGQRYYHQWPLHDIRYQRNTAVNQERCGIRDSQYNPKANPPHGGGESIGPTENHQTWQIIQIIGKNSLLLNIWNKKNNPELKTLLSRRWKNIYMRFFKISTGAQTTNDMINCHWNNFQWRYGTWLNGWMVQTGVRCRERGWAHLPRPPPPTNVTSFRVNTPTLFNYHTQKL